jgi:hypothetical protein
MAYDMANRWILTGGAEELPAIRLGRRLLVRSGLMSGLRCEARHDARHVGL